MDGIIVILIFALFIFVQGRAKQKLKKDKQVQASQQTAGQPEVRRSRRQQVAHSTLLEKEELLQKARENRKLVRNTSTSHEANASPAPPPLREQLKENKDSYKWQDPPNKEELERTIFTQRDLRQAVIWSEVLGPPKARKKRNR